MSLPVEPGDIIADKYRIVRVIGQGGMGVVFEAEHQFIPQRVAIKFQLAEAASGEVERFIREARAAVQLRSEHVAKVWDVGALANGTPFIVMEYLEGDSLALLRDTREPQPAKEVLEYVLQACEALAEAHSLGMVHRDLKPGNLFLTTRVDGTPLIKILDFGIAKINAVANPQNQELTTTNTILGSPRYLAPEQLTAMKDVDCRADIWGLGVILYELLGGAPPFQARTMAELCARLLCDPPPPLLTLVPELATELEAVVMRCLEKDRGDRYGSIEQLARALAPFAPERAQISVERVIGIFSASAKQQKSTPASSDDRPASPSPADQSVPATELPSTVLQGPRVARPKSSPPKQPEDPVEAIATDGSDALEGARTRRSEPERDECAHGAAQGLTLRSSSTTGPLEIRSPPTADSALRNKKSRSSLLVAGLCVIGAIAFFGGWLLRGPDDSTAPVSSAPSSASTRGASVTTATTAAEGSTSLASTAAAATASRGAETALATTSATVAAIASLPPTATIPHLPTSASSRGSIANTDPYCSNDSACTEHGRCSKRGGACVAASNADCRRASVCTVLGKCSAQQGRCVVGKSADCQLSQLCTREGRCVASGGRCQAGSSADCGRSTGCTTYGQCTVQNGRCMAVSDADCRRSRICKNKGQCQARSGACWR